MRKFNGIAMLVASNGRRIPIEWGLSLPSLQFPVGMSQAWFMAKADPADIRSGKVTREMQRESLADRAIQTGADYMMFLDDDTISPSYAVVALHRVLANNPDAAICGGIYCTKSDPAEPIVFMELGAGPYYQWTLGQVFECKGLGLGCMMVRTEALKNIPKPWFHEPHEAPMGKYEEFGENGETKIPIARTSGTDDLFLCNKVTEAGYKIYAHGGVIPVHVGADDKYYTLPLDTYPCRSFDEEQKKRMADQNRLAGSSGLTFDQWQAKLRAEEEAQKLLDGDDSD